MLIFLSNPTIILSCRIVKLNILFSFYHSKNVVCFSCLMEQFFFLSHAPNVEYFSGRIQEILLIFLSHTTIIYFSCRIHSQLYHTTNAIYFSCLLQKLLFIFLVAYTVVYSPFLVSYNTCRLFFSSYTINVAYYVFLSQTTNERSFVLSHSTNVVYCFYSSLIVQSMLYIFYLVQLLTIRFFIYF